MSYRKVITQHNEIRRMNDIQYIPQSCGGRESINHTATISINYTTLTGS